MSIKITKFKTNKINTLTGGKIADYRIKDWPENANLLHNSFLSKKGEYIGDYATGYWFVKQNLRVCNPHLLGVAEKRSEKGKLIGYLGYTHRGRALFKIGMRLFDAKYKPNKKDYTAKQWAEFEKEHKKHIEEEKKYGHKKPPISDVVPFTLRGKKVIKNMADAKQAAINLSKYLS